MLHLTPAPNWLPRRLDLGPQPGEGPVGAAPKQICTGARCGVVEPTNQISWKVENGLLGSTPPTLSPYPGHYSRKAAEPRCGEGEPWGHLTKRRMGVFCYCVMVTF